MATYGQFSGRQWALSWPPTGSFSWPLTGKTVYDLAQAFGCHRVTVSAVLKRRGVLLRRASPTDEQIDEMIRLYESGLSLAKVGRQFEVQASTVLAHLRARGVSTRSR